jgi:hypothetical protein
MDVAVVMVADVMVGAVVAVVTLPDRRSDDSRPLAVSHVRIPIGPLACFTTVLRLIAITARERAPHIAAA